jgi:hypothetical protein
VAPFVRRGATNSFKSIGRVLFDVGSFNSGKCPLALGAEPIRACTIMGKGTRALLISEGTDSPLSYKIVNQSDEDTGRYVPGPDIATQKTIFVVRDCYKNVGKLLTPISESSSI